MYVRRLGGGDCPKSKSPKKVTTKLKFTTRIVIQKVCHSPRGERGLTKNITKCDIGGGGYEPKRNVTPSKNIVTTIAVE